MVAEAFEYNPQETGLKLLPVISWAARHSSFYRKHQIYSDVLDKIEARPEDFEKYLKELPVIEKSELRRDTPAFYADESPAGFEPKFDIHTSGSTGMPVTIRGDQMFRKVRDSLIMREHRWHDRDFSKTHGFIRFLDEPHRIPGGTKLSSWGPPVSELHQTGQASAIHVARPIDEIADWLEKFDPNYLLVSPTIVEELIDMVSHQQLQNLIEVRTFAEPLGAELEKRILEKWKVPCSDVYSASEVGFIAMRCKENNTLHVQHDAIVVEVIHPDGSNCVPGETGRVVLTPLYNYSTPLIRYAIGDLATVGERCACGKHTMTLQKVHGRERNMFQTPEGKNFWPVAMYALRDITPIVQAQLIQTSLNHIQVNAVLERSLSPQEEQSVADKIKETLEYPFDISITPIDKIERGPGGKFEECISLLTSQQAPL